MKSDGLELTTQPAVTKELLCSIAEVDVQLEYLRIQAPTAGTVVRRLVDPGDMANPGQPLVTLEQNNVMKVRAGVGDDLYQAHPERWSGVGVDSRRILTRQARIRWRRSLRPSVRSEIFASGARSGDGQGDCRWQVAALRGCALPDISGFAVGVGYIFLTVC